MIIGLQSVNYQDNQENPQQQYHIFYTLHYLIQTVILPYLPISPLLLEIF